MNECSVTELHQVQSDGNLCFNVVLLNTNKERLEWGGRDDMNFFSVLFHYY